MHMNFHIHREIIQILVLQKSLNFMCVILGFNYALEEISVVFYMVLVAFVAFQSIFSEVGRSSSHFKREQSIDRET